jgi:hypothetical protein
MSEPDHRPTVNVSATTAQAAAARGAVARDVEALRGDLSRWRKTWPVSLTPILLLRLVREVADRI